MRKLGIDYGDSRIGLALSDETDTIASPYEVYRSRGWSRDIPYLAQLIREKKVAIVVIGDPLNMDGTAGERSALVRKFGSRLGAEAGVPIVYVDERLSTVEMEEFLTSQGVKKNRHKEYVDKLSAQWILKSYMDAQSLQAARGKNKE